MIYDFDTPPGVPTLALLVALLFSSPSWAHAFFSEGHAWAGAGAANINHAAPTASGWWGPRVDAGVVIQLGDFWRLGADVGASHHFARLETPEAPEESETLGPHTVFSTALGARYALDVFTYVPYVGFSVAFHPMGPPSESAPGGDPFSLRGLLGVDYRHSREFSFGVALDIHGPLLDPASFPHYSGLRLHVAYHFRRF